jgi:urea carboxylase
MEGPGGYQLIGRTVQVWSSWHTRPPFAPGTPWLLRNFDRISWYPVAPEELIEMRSEMAAGRFELRVEEGSFSVARYRAGLASEAASIAEFQGRQQRAFGAERERWRASGEFDRVRLLERRGHEEARAMRVAAPDEHLVAGDLICTLEAMKLELNVVAPVAGVVAEVLVQPGDQVPAGQPMVVLRLPEGG